MILNQLDTIFQIRFIIDTTGFKDSYSIYSEPFYLKDSLICISKFFKSSKEPSLIKWIFFFSKQSNSLKLILLYNVQKKEFYEVEYLGKV